ncbi:hypothetical protein AVEN_169696-1 [Araneus ventricosus]|uniref:Uncharacterized protein n=1 Tax=Araneus ventricosus TaxID=182803 RepID=A0A4Y2TXN0_ARAVE|nr:hypothetical protein AVEN_13130-1 [Araneus ventricosus]GBO04076.1 hypothetical protein AVEN_169696-1 [Araneus ventricosus]
MFTSELSSDFSVLSEHIAGPSTSTPKFPCPPLEEISSQDTSKNAAAKIAASMEASVREHSMFEKTTDHEVENSVKKWLVYSKDREGDRSHRTSSSANFGK